MKNRLTPHGLMLLAATLFILTSANVNGQAVGTKGPDFEVTLQGGGTFTLSEQAGKVVLVFFFGHNCPSCRAIGPTVEANLYQEFSENEAFTAIGLDTWAGSSESTVSGFRNSTGITFPLGINAASVAGDYGTTYDRLLVMDHNGIIVHKGSVVASNDVNNAKNAIQESLTATGLFSRDAENHSLKVYPVPATDAVTFESEDPLGEIRIYDASGRMVLRDLPGGITGPRTLVLDGLMHGLHFYRVESGGEVITGKLAIGN